MAKWLKHFHRRQTNETVRKFPKSSSNKKPWVVIKLWAESKNSNFDLAAETGFGAMGEILTLLLSTVKFQTISLTQRQLTNVLQKSSQLWTTKSAKASKAYSKELSKDRARVSSTAGKEYPEATSTEHRPQPRPTAQGRSPFELADHSGRFPRCLYSFRCRGPKTLQKITTFFEKGLNKIIPAQLTQQNSIPAGHPRTSARIPRPCPQPTTRACPNWWGHYCASQRCHRLLCMTAMTDWNRPSGMKSE